MKAVLISLAAVAILGLLAPDALAVKHRRPYGPGVKLGHGFDNNYGAAGCKDWGCGGTCYNTHSGSDFPVGMGTEIVAGANGTVTKVSQGCADWGYRHNPCGGYCGNYVRIAHADGTNSLFCHMKNGSIVVGVNQQVSCGQKLGLSASSGSSTGPHLHFGFYHNGSAKDSFNGSCSNTPGAWVDQGGYPGLPSTQCENNCECSPGAKQSDGCGNCGTRHRTCGGDCHWGGWSGCEGQGACSPGATESQACCDCGTKSRSCGGNCQWKDWGGCGGPNPAGPPGCDTGLDGLCKDGEIHCVGGCLACTQTVFPTEELCDGLDNDCDGPVDDGATKMGATPPPFAAQLEDLSAPLALTPGETAEAWVLFRNVGQAPWPAASTWLGAKGKDGAPSPLLMPEAWAAHDVAASTGEPVSPGEAALLSFPIHMPAGGEAATTAFELSVEGVPIACPSPGFTLDPVALAAPAPLAPADPPDADAGGDVGAPDADIDASQPPESEEDSSEPSGAPSADPAADVSAAASGAAADEGCAHAHGGPPWWAAVVLLALVGRRRLFFARGF